MKAKKNIFTFTCKMFIFAVIVYFFMGLLPNLLSYSIVNYKYGMEFVYEILMGVIVFVVMLLFGNSYVFTTKKEKLGASLLVGLPLIIFSVINLIFNLASVERFILPNIINLVLLSLAIGLTEEFMCRGWLQNEFIERFGESRRKVILSICLSGFIFGLLHLFNLSTVGLFSTLLQILSVTAAGVFLGAVYYRTKNIWSVVLLHALYDFSMLIVDVGNVKDCGVVSNPNFVMLMYSLLVTVLMVSYFAASSVYTLRRSKINKLVSEKEKVNNKVRKEEADLNKRLFIYLGIILVVIFVPINDDDLNNYSVCYKYEDVVVDSYSESYYHNIDNFKLYYSEPFVDTSLAEYKYEVFKDKDTLKVGVRNSDNYNDGYFDVENVVDYAVIENEDDYTIVIIGDNGNTLNYVTFEKGYLSSISFIEGVTKNLHVVDVPVVNKVGYLEKDNSNYKYPLALTPLNDKLIVDKNDKILLIKNK